MLFTSLLAFQSPTLKRNETIVIRKSLDWFEKEQSTREAHRDLEIIRMNLQTSKQNKSVNSVIIGEINKRMRLIGAVVMKRMGLMELPINNFH